MTRIDLELLQDEWKTENHVTRGGFNRFEQCQVAPKGISGGAYETCCGMDDFPNVGVRKTNHNGCCGPHGFNRNVVYYVTAIT